MRLPSLGDRDIDDRTLLIRAEYLEIPGLSLTKPQVERLWRLDPRTAEAVLTELVEIKFLKRSVRGTYIRADLG